MSRNTTVLLTLFVLLLPSERSSRADTREIVQWETQEWTRENATWEGSPFDLRASVAFTHADSGQTVTTEMFYDGGQTWKFRFTATAAGKWTYVSASGDASLNGLAGTVIVKANPRARGFLTAVGQKWSWQGTGEVFTPQLAMLNYRFKNDAPKSYARAATIDALHDVYLAGHGFNGYHQAVVGGYWFDYDRADTRVDRSMTDPDPRTFRALELLIKKTHQAGGMVHIWAWGDRSRSQTPDCLAGGENGPVDRRLQRYIAARLGPLPGWSMGYGFDLDEWASSTQIQEWRDYFHRHAGWSHFFGGRPAGPNRGEDHSAFLAWNRNLDYASYEHHQPTYGVYVAALDATPEKPVMSEDRFRIRVPPRYPDKDYNQELVRRGLYHSTLAGGVANIWGHRENEGIFPNRHEIRTYSRFFYGRPRRFLPDMVRAGQLSSDGNTRVLHSPSTRSYVLYRERAASVQIDLSKEAGPLPAVAVDTTNPYAEVALGMLQPAVQKLTLPSESDWVVAIGTFAGSSGESRE